MYLAVVIAEAKRIQAPNDLRGNPKLFQQFSLETGFPGFSDTPLAAREFPEARKLLALGPLGDQHPPVGIDKRHCDNEQKPQER